MYEKILDFWFEELTPKQWYAVDHELDGEMNERFSALLARAEKSELEFWRTTAEGRLAEVILLDQFSRNIYRGTAKAFSNDVVALVLAQEAVRHRFDEQLDVAQRAFLYMPYMHSESPEIHQKAVQLFKQPGLEHNLEFEFKHKVIIDRFGRYPHRNEMLGRVSTSEESEFLKEPGSSF